MKREIELEAINMALVDEFSNAHGLTFEQSINQIVKEFMIGEFKKQAVSTGTMMGFPPGTSPYVWHSKGSV